MFLKKVFVALGLVFALLGADARSPVAVVAGKDARELYVAESASNDVAVVNPQDGTIVRRIALPGAAGGLALSPDGNTLYVPIASAEGGVYVVDAASGQVTATVKAGHTPVAPAVAPDGTRVYLCNRFSNDVSVIDAANKAEIARIGVVREPVACALTPDGRFLFVANLLPDGPSNGEFIAASVSVIDAAALKAVATVTLPNGSTGLRGICASPDGQYVYVTHILAHYQMPTTQVDHAWMNANALSVISVERKTLVNTVLLDDVQQGAANPWAVACSADGKFICVTHAGTHELSIIDRVGLHEKLDKVASGTRVSEVSASSTDVPNDLSFLVGLRRRVALGVNGPRALAVASGTAFVAGYFSDSLCAVDLGTGEKRAIVLEANAATPERRGEMLFNDATLCFQHWQSCATCHPDARADGLNWDLLNDGLGNPRNTRSMLLSHQTPPVMTLAVRENAEKAVRSGMKFIQFSERPEADAAAIDAYLKGMKPVPSPRLVNGGLPADAQKGKEVFQRAGCASCHPEGLYTDLKQYDLGMLEGADKGKPVDTPTLIETWRTAPYLHDGRAATILEVLTKCNPDDRHGKTSGLSTDELKQLAEYVESL
jgi:YVTN family beta-propeller protein